MSNWKVNLVVLWFGQFIVLAGMTMIIPFLPLYIQELGIENEKQVAIWAGVIFAGNFVTAFLFQPLWGRLSDRYGRKVMLLRSGFGMAITIVLMGLATNVWQLLLLRLLNGTISGFSPAAVALVGTNTPQERMGFAMGVLQSGTVAGTILGPAIGGLMNIWIGFSPIFYITGAMVFAAAILAALFVKENFDKAKAASKPRLSMLASINRLRSIPQLPALFLVTFMIQFANLSLMPLIPLFIQEMHGSITLLAFYAGLVSSATGLSNMLSSPILGRLGDRKGNEKILAICLLCAAIAFIPQAFVQNVWQFIALRFLLGFFIGGLIPSVNSLIRQYTPEGMEGQSYSFNTSFFALGNMLGPLIGGFLSGWVSIRGVIILTAVIMFVNFLWVRTNLLRHNMGRERRE